MRLVGKYGLRVVLVTFLAILSAPTLAAQTFTTLLSFNGTDGANSTAGLIRATDGNFYRTTSYAGAHSNGSVFRITPAGKLTTLYSFCSLSACADGYNPLGALIQATDGNLYGMTLNGAVFKISLTGTFTTLAETGATDPVSALIQGKDGNFYGTTSRGGANICQLRPGYKVTCGTVFKMMPTGTLTTLASFSAADGFDPAAPLVQGTDGNFYGTTSRGGAVYPGDGTIFKVTPTGTLTVLHSFNAPTDGDMWLAGLIQGTDGDFYGVTSFGGTNAGYGGTVFKITSSGTFTILHSFGSNDGTGASAALLQASDGNFYGTTSGYGVSNTGTIFKMTPSGTLTTLFTFDSTDGELPYSTLVEGATGILYRTTEYGANTTACSEGCGTIFSLSAGLK